MTRPIDDPQVVEWWADYLHVVEGGNPLGMTFAEYVASRLSMLGPRWTFTTNTRPSLTKEWSWCPTCMTSHPVGAHRYSRSPV